ncbi:MAG: hypothetical protein KGJ98_07955 [Chloroflexota bacterium]|nr:hypothetical protein [Chloroflexota bacterium]MDE3102156.1 hypothetical protein [Chloroflexota bacterium]
MRSQFLTTMIQLASAAFGVVAALAWNAFITELVKTYLPAQSGLIGLLVYAVVVTVIAVIVLSALGRAAERSGGKSAV